MCLFKIGTMNSSHCNIDKMRFDLKIKYKVLVRYRVFTILDSVKPTYSKSEQRASFLSEARRTVTSV